jgi:hypothetical protein
MLSVESDETQKDKGKGKDKSNDKGNDKGSDKGSDKDSNKGSDKGSDKDSNKGSDKGNDKDSNKSTVTFTESSDEKTTDTPEVLFVPKKYIMKANELTKKDMMIVNREMKENLTTLGDFLHMMSLMRNVEETYSSSTYIITSNNNKKVFKQMLLENPYLHFTDFVVKTSLSKSNISDIKQSSKRTILLIDTDAADFSDNTLNKYLELRKDNVQLVLLSTQYTKTSAIYNLLGEHRLLIHRKERLKSMQRIFYKQVIKILCIDKIEFDNYFYIMNHDNFGVRYVIIKKDQIRYN